MRLSARVQKKCQLQVATKTVKLSEFPREIREFSERTLEDQKKATIRGIARSLPELVAASPVDTGLYAQSWHFSVEETKAIIGNYAPYAPMIEFGTRPFTPPIAPLLAWAKRVLQDGSQPPDYSPRVWALARGVQNKIAAQGLKPRHILTNMVPKIIDNIKEELRKLGG